jgi:hypothetical protein
MCAARREKRKEKKEKLEQNRLMFIRKILSQGRGCNLAISLHKLMSETKN